MSGPWQLCGDQVESRSPDDLIRLDVGCTRSLLYRRRLILWDSEQFGRVYALVLVVHDDAEAEPLRGLRLGRVLQSVVDRVGSNPIVDENGEPIDVPGASKLVTGCALNGLEAIAT